MISQSLQDSLNEQIKNEFYRAHAYLSMSSWFEDKGLPGFGKWMRVQYQEELAQGDGTMRRIQARHIAGQGCNSTFISGSVRRVRVQTPHPTSRLSAVRYWCSGGWDDKWR